MQKLDTRERGTRSGRRLSSSHVAIAEFFFFKEFEARFNFIVFEYLIYPHKVFVNIWDSYPFGRAVAAVALISGIVFWRMRLLGDRTHNFFTSCWLRYGCCAGHPHPG